MNLLDLPDPLLEDILARVERSVTHLAVCRRFALAAPKSRRLLTLTEHTDAQISWLLRRGWIDSRVVLRLVSRTNRVSLELLARASLVLQHPADWHEHLFQSLRDAVEVRNLTYIRSVLDMEVLDRGSRPYLKGNVRRNFTELLRWTLDQQWTGLAVLLVRSGAQFLPSLRDRQRVMSSLPRPLPHRVEVELVACKYSGDVNLPQLVVSAVCEHNAELLRAVFVMGHKTSWSSHATYAAILQINLRALLTAETYVGKLNAKPVWDRYRSYLYSHTARYGHFEFIRWLVDRDVVDADDETFLADMVRAANGRTAVQLMRASVLRAWSSRVSEAAWRAGETDPETCMAVLRCALDRGLPFVWTESSLATLVRWGGAEHVALALATGCPVDADASRRDPPSDETIPNNALAAALCSRRSDLVEILLNAGCAWRPDGREIVRLLEVASSAEDAHRLTWWALSHGANMPAFFVNA